MKDSTLRAVDALVDKLAERPGADDLTMAADMVRDAGLDVAYALAQAALVGAARAKRRAVALETERRHQQGKRQLREAVEDYVYVPDAAGIAMRERMQAILDEYVAGIRMEWEAELLETTFSLADGTVTTWGTATLDQHEERAGMFKRNAVANAEGYARHQRAIDDLRGSGAGSLGEMVSVAA